MDFDHTIAYTFDDVLLVPKYSEIESRKDVCTKARLTDKFTLDIPIIAANMDTVTEVPMMVAMLKNGGVGVLHRFMKNDHMIRCFNDYWAHSVPHRPCPIAFAVGVNDHYRDVFLHLEKNDTLQDALVFVDIAHGDCKRVVETVKTMKKIGVQVVAGNVATHDGTRRLIDAGADAIKVGIGPGSMCTTRLVTGHGVPQLSAIFECSLAADDSNIPIIADGGIRHSGDIVKAIAAGASTVMIGSLLAGCNETPGEIIDIPVDYHPAGVTSVQHKRYRGMASRDAMMGWKNDSETAPEGESMLVRCKGSVKKVISDLVGGLRSGMSYCGAHTLEELYTNASFRLVSGSTVIENKAHGKN
jgi:IMP dehydrogenase